MDKLKDKQMDQETLKKAKEISERLIECEDSLKSIRYTQSENVVPRVSYFSCNGLENGVKIPHSLFRTIGKLIESEYIIKINALQKQLDDL